MGNGVTYFAAQALSFELPDVALLKQNLDATAWSVGDVKEQNPDLPIGVVALHPLPGTETYPRAIEAYERARIIFEGLDARVLARKSLSLGRCHSQAGATRRRLRLIERLGPHLVWSQSGSQRWPTQADAPWRLSPDPR